MRRNDDLKSLLEHYFLKVPSKLDLRFAGPVWRHCCGIQTAGDELPMNCHRIANESAARSAFLVAY
jgi:hypothetical protein